MMGVLQTLNTHSKMFDSWLNFRQVTNIQTYFDKLMLVVFPPYFSHSIFSLRIWSYISFSAVTKPIVSKWYFVVSFLYGKGTFFHRMLSWSDWFKGFSIEWSSSSPDFHLTTSFEAKEGSRSDHCLWKAVIKRNPFKCSNKEKLGTGDFAVLRV